MARLGIVTGLAFEAEILRQAARRLSADEQPLIAAAGGNGSKAEELATCFADSGVAGLVSFGLCGALDPNLATGDIILARSIHRTDAPPIHADDAWRRAAQGFIGPWRTYRVGNILESHFVVDRVDTKSHLRSDGADVVDMESYGVAYTAKRTGLPFLGIRAVVDTADQALPQSAVAAMSGDGTVNLRALTAQLVKRPTELMNLISLSRQTACARKGLRDLAFTGLPLFGLRS